MILESEFQQKGWTGQNYRTSTRALEEPGLPKTAEGNPKTIAGAKYVTKSTRNMFERIDKLKNSPDEAVRAQSRNFEKQLAIKMDLPLETVQELGTRLPTPLEGPVLELTMGLSISSVALQITRVGLRVRGARSYDHTAHIQRRSFVALH